MADCGWAGVKWQPAPRLTDTNENKGIASNGKGPTSVFGLSANKSYNIQRTGIKLHTILSLATCCCS